MNFIYNSSVYIVGLLLKIVALFNAKLKLFVNGRKKVYPYLIENRLTDYKIIWIRYLGTHSEYDKIDATNI